MGIKLVKQARSICDNLIQRTAGLVAPHNQGEVETFASKLSGIGNISYADLLEQMGDVAIPGDFRHMRIYNLTRSQTGSTKWWLEMVSAYLQPLLFKDVLLNLVVMASYEDVTDAGPGIWVETVALPVTEPGVLELGMKFEPLN